MNRKRSIDFGAGSVYQAPCVWVVAIGARSVLCGSVDGGFTIGDDDKSVDDGGVTGNGDFVW